MNYLLRAIPSDLYQRAKQRAAKEGHSLRWVFLALLARYVKKGAGD